jgi:hypothetical protein
MTNPKPILAGREISKAEMRVIHQYLQSVDTISGISDDMQVLIARFWPEQLLKMKPPKEASK